MNAIDTRRHVLRRLEDLHVPTNTNLPLLDEPVVLRSAKEVAVRIVILYALTGLANGADAQKLREWLQENGLYKSLLPEERSKFSEPLSESDLTEVSWRQESLFALGWAAKLINDLGLPTQECRLAPLFSKIPPEVDTESFIRELELRSTEEVFYQADLHYCLHWAVRHESRILRSKTARQLKADVIIERRYALEWLINGEDWADFALDT